MLSSYNGANGSEQRVNPYCLLAKVILLRGRTRVSEHALPVDLTELVFVRRLGTSLLTTDKSIIYDLLSMAPSHFTECNANEVGLARNACAVLPPVYRLSDIVWSRAGSRVRLAEPGLRAVFNCVLYFVGVSDVARGEKSGFA